MLRPLKNAEFDPSVEFAYQLALDPARSGRLRPVHSA